MKFSLARNFISHYLIESNWIIMMLLSDLFVKFYLLFSHFTYRGQWTCMTISWSNGIANHHHSYLWSRADWTASHKKIALEYGHITVKKIEALRVIRM